MNETLELLTQILNYPLFTIQQDQVTVRRLLIFVGILFCFWLFGKILIKKWVSRLLVRFRLDEGTSYNLTRVGYYLFLTLGILISFQFVGINMSSLVVLFGFLSVGIGFGLQNLTSNFISGLIILFERPIRVGDRITIGDEEGDVTEINMRSTTIKSLNNIAIIVPNSEFISSRVINWSYSDPKVRIDLDVGVSYSSDLDLVLETMQRVGLESPDVLKSPKPEVMFMSFGDSAWDLRLRVWIQNPKENIPIRSRLNIAIVRAFRENGIEIPFPQRDLHLKSMPAGVGRGPV